jgi:hypothetical protein
LNPLWMASSKLLGEPAITSVTLATLPSVILLTSLPPYFLLTALNISA